MALGNHDIGKHLVTYGDQSMVTGGQPLYTMVGGKRRSKIHVTKPGQIVAYTTAVGAIPTTVDISNLTAETAKHLFIAVGKDSGGVGYTTELKHIGIEQVSSCDLVEVEASSPKCGSPAVQDLYFKIDKPGTYGVLVRIEDNTTRDFAPLFKGYEEFTAIAKVTQEEFDDPNFDEDQVACDLVNQLQENLDLYIKGKPYPDWKGKGLPRNYHATRLGTKSLVYCFSPTELESCEDCTHIDAILKATVNDQEIVFSGNTDPSDATKTIRGQLEGIAAQINEAFEAQYGEHANVGSAYVTGSFADCCPLELHVNTCDANFALLTTGDATITPCKDYNPFTEYGSFTNAQECIDCGDAPTTTSYVSGIRVIGERVSTECGCIINKPLAWYARTVDIVPINDFLGSQWEKVQVAKAETPGQFGSQIQWYEYQEEVGGEGRNHKRTSNLRGWIPTPEAISRAQSVTAECKKDYCSYFMRHEATRRGPLNATMPRPLTLHGYIHVPADDVTTKASIEEFLTEYASLSTQCKVSASVTCDTSQVVSSLALV